jgi:hypothetical protein
MKNVLIKSMVFVCLNFGLIGSSVMDSSSSSSIIQNNDTNSTNGINKDYSLDIIIIVNNLTNSSDIRSSSSSSDSSESSSIDYVQAVVDKIFQTLTNSSDIDNE